MDLRYLILEANSCETRDFWKTVGLPSMCPTQISPKDRKDHTVVPPSIPPSSSRPSMKAHLASCILRLPRDLRDRIYAFCVQGAYDNEVIVRRLPRQENEFKLLVREPLGLHSYQWVEEPITSRVDLKSLEPQMARELLESYYGTRTFKISHDGLALLACFLATDSFGFGVVPANHAEHLQLHIQPFAYALLDGPANRMWEEAKCLETLEGLASIKTARLEYHIDVELAQESLDDVDYENLCNDVGHFLLGLIYVTEKLKENGLRIKTTISGAWDEKRRRQLHRKFLCSLGSRTICNREIESSSATKSLE